MKSILFLVILTSIILLSCNEPTGGGEDGHGVYITVVDSTSGKPLDSAIVRVYYTVGQVEMDPNYKCINTPNPFYNQTDFGFTLNTPQNVIIILINQEKNIVMDTIINQIFKEGRFNILWGIPDSLTEQYDNGFYTLRIILGDSVTNYEMFLLKFNYLSTEINKGVPIKVYQTQTNGLVVIQPGDLPWIGRRFRKYGEAGFNLGDYLIKDSINIEVVLDAYYTKKRTIYFDKKVAKYLTVKM